MWGGYGHMGNLGWGMGFGLGWIFQLIFLGLIIWLIVSLVRNRDGIFGASGQHKEDDALEILRKRYAKGEITKEQFEQMKNDLG